MNKKSRRIAWILIIVMLFSSYGFPFLDGVRTAYAAEDTLEEKSEDSTEVMEEATESEQDAVKANENVQGIELIEQRDEYTKHYQLENGANEAVLYGVPIHYLEDGEYKEIDNTLTLVKDNNGNQVYENTNNELKVQISPNSDKATITKDKYSMTWTINEILKDKAGKKDDVLTKEEWKALSEGEKRHNIPNFSSVVTYEDVLKDIDLQYVIVSNQLKENIIFKTKTELATITEQVKAKGLTLIKNDDGSIDAVDSDTQEKIFYIPPAFLIDDKGEMSENIGLDVTLSGNTYTLTYTLDKEWMETATYPVIFDPTATVNTGTDGSYVIDNRICQNYPGNNYRSSYIMCSGNGSSSGENRSLIKFKSLPSITASKIYYAKLQAKQIYNAAATSRVAVHKITSNWDQYVKWSNKPSYAGAYSSVSVSPTRYVTYTWNITQIARDWYTTNYGLQLRDTASSSNYKEWATWNSTYHDGPKAYFYYDTTAPSAPTSIYTAPGAASTWTNDRTLNLHWSGITDSGGSGLQRVVYRIDGGSWIYPSTSYGVASGSIPITISSSGTHTIQMRAIDNVGNWGPYSSTVYYKLDISAPNTPAQPTLAKTDGALNSGNSAQIKVSFNAVVDNPSGRGNASYYDVFMKKNGGSETVVFNNVSAGTHTLYNQDDNATYQFRVQAFDSFGRASGKSGYTSCKTLDRTGPVIGTGDVTMSSDWTNDKTPTITWQNIGDEGGGTTALEYQINSTAGDWLSLGTYATGSGTADCSELADGSHHIYVRAKDGQGNRSNVVDLTYNKDTAFEESNVGIVKPEEEDVVPLEGDTTYDISAFATDPHFATWSLDYALGTDPDELLDYTNITSGTTVLETTNLQTWNLSPLDDSRFYTLRLTATDAAGNTVVKHYKVLYALDAEMIAASLTMTLLDSQSVTIGTNDDISTDSVTAEYTPTTDLLGTLYVNDVEKDSQEASEDELTFDPLEYDNGWLYPEGSQAFIRVMTEDSNGDYYFSNTTYQLHKIVDVFNDTDGLIDHVNTELIDDTRIELTNTGGVYDTSGSFQSTEQEINGRICYVELTAHETLPTNTSILYYLVHDGGQMEIAPNDITELNISTNDAYLKAVMSTTDTAVTPGIESWHLDVMAIPFSDSIVVNNTFDVNARGFCELDDTIHDETIGSIKLDGIDFPVVSYPTSGSVQSTLRVTPGNVYEVFLAVDDTTPQGTDISYYVSTDGGSTWSDENALVPGTDPNDPEQWILVDDLKAGGMDKGNRIKLKAVLTGDGEHTPILHSWTLKCRQTMAGEAHDVKVIDEPDKLSTLVDANYMTLLRWEASETAGVTYNVYRSTTPYFDYTQMTPLEEGVTNNYWSDFNINPLPAGDRYYYKVTAVKEINGHDRESLPSNEAWADPVSEDALDEMLGLQNFWSYSGFKTSAGTGYVNVANGNLVYKSTDMVISGPFYASVMSRTYNSLGETKTPMGYGWDYSFNTCMLKEYNTAGTEVVALILKDGDGSFHRFTGNDTTGYSTAKGTFMELDTVEDSGEVIGYTITRKDGITYHFDAVTMKLEKFCDLNGKLLTFSYDDRGNLETVTNSVGETLTLAYLVECQLPGEEDYTYVNGNIDMLDTVTWTNGTESIVYTYTYNDDDKLENVSATIGGTTEIVETFEYGTDTNGNTLADDAPNFVIIDAEDRTTYVELAEEVAGVSDENEVVKVYEPIQFETSDPDPTIAEYLDDCFAFDFDPDDDQSWDRTTIINSYEVGISYEYDSDGLLEKKTDAKGNSINYTHNTDYLVDSVSYENTLAGDTQPTTIKNVYTYNSNGNITNVKVLGTSPGGNTFSDLGPQTTYAYNDTNFPNKATSVTVQKDGSNTVTTTYDYDTNGNVKSTTVADGSTSTYGTTVSIEKTTMYDYYDGVESGGYAWQLKSVTDEYGKETRYVYDTATNDVINGLMIHIEEYDASSNYVRTLATYDYDAYGRTDTVSEIYDKNVTSSPNVTDMNYDEMGRIEQVINIDDTCEMWDYDDTGRLLTHSAGIMGATFEAENSTDYVYDVLGRVTNTTIEKDPTISTDDIETKVSYTYTNYSLGILNGKWDSDGGISGVEADVVVSTDAEGTKTLQYYNILGRLVKIQISDGSTYITTAEYTYDDIGNMIETVDSAGRVSKAYYDELNRQYKTVVDPFNAADGFDNMNIETQYSYDYLGNTTQVKQVAYVSESNQTSTNYITDYVYDDLSRLERVTQVNPNYGQSGEPQYLQTTYYYDREVTVGSDDLIMNYYMDPQGNVNETYFDLMGHKVMDWNKADTSDGDDADGEYMKTQYEYNDIRGLVTKVTRTDGTFEEYDYDIMGRPLTIEYFEQGSSTSTEYLEYSYNDLGQIETQSSAVGSTSHDTSYRYDRLGQPISVWEGTWDNGQPDKVTDGLDIEYTYNDAGQVINVNYNTTSSTEHDIEYLYDDYGRIDEIRLDPVTSPTVDNNTVRKYFYDSTTGELDYMRDYREFATVTGQGDYIQTDFTYNSAGLVTNIKYTDADLVDANNTAGITEQYTVEYDGRGFIIGEQLDIDYSTTEAMETMYKAYEYDSIGRLVKAANGDTQETTWSNWDNLTEYTYDRVGNRTSMDDGTDVYGYAYTQFNQLEEMTKNSTVYESYEYDLRGNQTIKYTDYSSGNPTKAVAYTYDLQNRLEEVGTTTDITNLTNVTSINTNIYNAGGQRISKTEEGTTEKYFYTGGAMIYTQDNNGTMLTENILDLDGNVIASKRFDDDDDPGTPNEWEDQYFFYHYDIRGSVTAIVDPNGDSVKEYTYDEFGNLEETGEATFDNELTFTGSVKDTSTGLQYMNARYYEAKTGRFISQDSYTGNAYEPWTQHLYSYCGNNPTNFIDPTGHSATSLQAEIDELKRQRKLRITFRDNYAKNRWKYEEGSDMFNLLTGGWLRNRQIVKDLNKQIFAKEDELEAAKADLARKKTIIETAVQDLVEDTHLSDNMVDIILENDNTKVKVDFDGSMDMIGVNTGDGTLHLLSRNDNNIISKDDLKTNYLYANVDVMLCMDIYEVICEVNNKEYDLEDKITTGDFVNEHKMHLYGNYVYSFEKADSVQTDMTKDGSFIFNNLLIAPSYSDFVDILE